MTSSGSYWPNDFLLKAVQKQVFVYVKPPLGNINIGRFNLIKYWENTSYRVSSFLLFNFRDDGQLKTSQFFCKRISSNLENVGNAVKSVIDYLKSICGPLDECLLFEIKVILNELISNAIKHGNKEDDQKFVKISAQLKNYKDLFIIIEDSGEGYNYNDVLAMPACTGDTEDINDLKETGRGLLIVKNLCDEIKFNKKGNKVMIVKSIGTD